jgi:hypothetical protein
VQLFFGFRIVGVDKNAIYWTYFDTLRFIVMTYALSTHGWVYLIDNIARVNRGVRAFGFTNVTVNAFVSN